MRRSSSGGKTGPADLVPEAALGLRALSAPDGESCRQDLGQTRGEDFRLGALDGVRQANEFGVSPLGIHDGIAGSRVAVARLADGARVDQVPESRLEGQGTAGDDPWRGV